MKIFILVLIALAFLQTTIIPLDLILVVLLLRSYIKPGKENLILATVFGIFLAHLMNEPMGPRALIYLVAVELTQVLSGLPIHKNLFFGGFSLAISLSLEKLILWKILTVTPNFLLTLLELLTALPIYLVFKFWEER